MEAKREAKLTITPVKSLNASVKGKLQMKELNILELQQQHKHDEDELSMLIDEMNSKFRVHMKLLEQGMVFHEKKNDLHKENKTHKNHIEELENEIESSLDLRNH